MAAVVVHAGPVVAAAVDLDPVVLDGAPLHLEEVIDQVRRAGSRIRPAAAITAGEHLRRRQRQPRLQRVDQAGVRGVVIDPADPLRISCSSSPT